MRCVIPVRLVTDPAWDESAGSSGEFVFQASPPASEAHASLLHNPGGVADMEEDDAPAYTRDSYISLENA
jgi:hypothetical protein